MRITSNSSRASKSHYYFGVMIFCMLLSLFSISAKAVVIDFDDLVYVPTWPEDFFGDHALTDEYQDQGLLIRGGFLAEWHEGTGPSASEPNYLSAGHDLRLTFIGELPTFVSMYVSANSEQAVYLKAFDSSSELIASHTTDGWQGFDTDPLYVPNQLVSFNAHGGISEIFISDFYFRRTGAMIDDITFTYSAQVPEPGSAFLFGLGLAAIFGRAYAGRSKNIDRIAV